MRQDGPVTPAEVAQDFSIVARRELSRFVIKDNENTVVIATRLLTALGGKAIRPYTA